MLISDFYTKPLQGKLFRLFRNLILNIDDSPTRNFQLALNKLKASTSSTAIKKSTLQECVDENTTKYELGENKENMSPGPKPQNSKCEVAGSNPSNNKYKLATPNLSYLDAARRVTKHSLAPKDTRETVFSQHPALLLKLRNVANACLSKTTIEQ